MADTDTLSRVRAALDESERIAADRIDLTIDDGVLVLRGSVASPEDSSVAGLVAEEHADAVRNELAVDAHLREQPDNPGDADLDPEGGNAPDEDPDLRGSDGGMVADTAYAFGENEPWDPPDEPHLAPTGAEQRGVSEGPTSDEPIADAGAVDEAAGDAEAPSAPDLSAEELARSARGQQAPADPAADRKA